MLHRHSCNCLCIMPPDPALEEKIVNTKAAIQNAKDSGRAMGDFKAGKNTLGLDEYITIITRPKKTRPDTFTSPVGDFAPILGVKKTIVLLVDFSDKPHTQTKAHYESMMFSVGSYAGGSMRDYYKEVSYNKLDVQGEVHGWFRAPRPKSYYTNNDYGFGTYPTNAQKLVEDVIDLANPTVNFGGFDNDGDGFLEAVVIIAAGSGGEQTGNKGDIWSHKWNIGTKTVDGKKINKYFMAPEDGKVGVMSHELGHLLMSWPDLYDTDYSSKGTGKWDLMAGGSWNNSGNTPAHPTAWCKVQAGWINPVVVSNAEQNAVIPPYKTDAVVFKLPVNGNVASKEYYLLSNRKKLGFDSALPGEGLIIEHIDDNQSNNTDESHYLVDIEQADGLRQLNSNANSGDANDTFPTGANDRFTNTSSPNSKTYAIADSTVSVTNIKRVGNNITATVKTGVVSALKYYNGLKVIQVYASVDTKNAYVIVTGFSWQKISATSTDGVTNIFEAACNALTGNKTVDVYMDGVTIFRIVVR